MTRIAEHPGPTKGQNKKEALDERVVQVTSRGRKRERTKHWADLDAPRLDRLGSATQRKSALAVMSSNVCHDPEYARVMEARSSTLAQTASCINVKGQEAKSAEPSIESRPIAYDLTMDGMHSLTAAFKAIENRGRLIEIANDRCSLDSAQLDEAAVRRLQADKDREVALQVIKWIAEIDRAYEKILQKTSQKWLEKLGESCRQLTSLDLGLAVGTKKSPCVVVGRRSEIRR